MVAVQRGVGVVAVAAELRVGVGRDDLARWRTPRVRSLQLLVLRRVALDRIRGEGNRLLEFVEGGLVRDQSALRESHTRSASDLMR